MKVTGIRQQAIVIKFVVFIFAVFSALLPMALSLTPVYAQQATLSLSPSSGTFNKGCQFTADIRLNTGGAQTDGTDAIILYDPTTLTTNTNSIASGNVYPDYPGSSVCENENLCPGVGRIFISGLSSVTSAIAANGTLGTITFTVKPDAPEGATKVSFDFDPNDKAKTTDSNVVMRGSGSDAGDILNTVVDGNYVIGSGTSCANGGTVKTGSGSISTPSGGLNDTDNSQFVKKTLPDAGTQELTYMIGIVGTTLVILGILGFALL